MANFSSAIFRSVPGAFILNSGIEKLKADAQTSAGIQQMAVSGIPALKKIPSEHFAKVIGGSEIAVGGALLAPFVPNRLAGAALAAFGGGMLTMYFRNEENTQADGIRPTPNGIPLAKDSWLLSTGLGLMALGQGDAWRDKMTDRKIRKAEKKAAKEAAKDVRSNL